MWRVALCLLLVGCGSPAATTTPSQPKATVARSVEHVAAVKSFLSSATAVSRTVAEPSFSRSTLADRVKEADGAFAKIPLSSSDAEKEDVERAKIINALAKVMGVFVEQYAAKALPKEEQENFDGELAKKEADLAKQIRELQQRITAPQ